MERMNLTKIYLIEEKIEKLKYELYDAKKEAIKLNDKIDSLEDKRNKLEEAFYPLVAHLTQPLREVGKIKL